MEATSALNERNRISEVKCSWQPLFFSYQKSHLWFANARFIFREGQICEENSSKGVAVD